MCIRDRPYVDKAKSVFNNLIELSKRGNQITEQNIDYALSLSFTLEDDKILEIDQDVIARTILGKPIKPKTLGQKQYVDLIREKMIVFGVGPAGTGKTYLAKEIAKELTDGNEEQIGFVQFHPSYDYTDFVEGLRPVSNGDGAIEFRLQDGIFKDFCQKAKEAQLIGGQDNFDEAWDSYFCLLYKCC